MYRQPWAQCLHPVGAVGNPAPRRPRPRQAWRHGCQARRASGGGAFAERTTYSCVRAVQELREAGLLASPAAPEPRAITREDLASLVMLDAICHESLRIMPPAPIGGIRELDRDTSVRIRLPGQRGTCVSACQPLSAHRVALQVAVRAHPPATPTRSSHSHPATPHPCLPQVRSSVPNGHSLQ